MGGVLIRRGARHDWYQNPRTKVSQPVPRHTEIKDVLAKHILKMLSDRTGLTVLVGGANSRMGPEWPCVQVNARRPDGR